MLSDSEPQVIVSVPCPSCHPCEFCQGTGVVFAALPLAGADSWNMGDVEIEATSGIGGKMTYKINGHEANEAAYELVLRALDGKAT